MKFLYKPLGIAFGVLGGILAGTVFKQIWKLVADEEDAPKATERERGWGEVLPAAALQGAIFALVKAAVGPLPSCLNRKYSRNIRQS